MSIARKGGILNHSDLFCVLDEKIVRSGQEKKNITSPLTTFLIFPYIVKLYSEHMLFPEGGYLKLLTHQISILADDTFIKGNGSRVFFRMKESHREVSHFLCFSCLLLGGLFAQQDNDDDKDIKNIKEREKEKNEEEELEKGGKS
ncbi:hypothetical protein E5288_WYG009080 [Bos mutus]|uniref:Uncharacterized protein n=1 Tax=Bos mutus TaxID=72004 RepID=A0A6B0QS68_9CETA|nr:hypothetical protein [Bos mutus]